MSNLIDHAIEKTPFPKSETEFRTQLQEVASMKYEQGTRDAIRSANEGRLVDVFNTDQLLEKLRQQQVNKDYLMKVAARKLQGVFRMPEDADELLKRLNELL